MPLLPIRRLLLDAQAEGYAVGAFNVENMEMALAICEAAQAEMAPVILQTTPSTVRYADVDMYRAISEAAALHVSTPVALHLDHGNSVVLATQAIEAGYPSIMIDGSQLPYEENVHVTRQVVKYAMSRGVSVEAELGMIGGKEDDLTVGDTAYTDPTIAADFVRRTGIDALAVAIGTAHGTYAQRPVLDLARLSAIRRLVDIPLVLHGASGLSKTDVTACVVRGICKVNFATELRAAYTRAVRDTLAENTDVFDPKVYGQAGRKNVRALTQDWVRTLGCAGRG